MVLDQDALSAGLLVGEHPVAGERLGEGAVAVPRLEGEAPRAEQEIVIGGFARGAERIRHGEVRAHGIRQRDRPRHL